MLNTPLQMFLVMLAGWMKDAVEPGKAP